MKMGAQNGQLMTPRIPELGKAMQQDNEIVAAPAFGVVQANAVCLGVAMPYFHLGRIAFSICHLTFFIREFADFLFVSVRVISWIVSDLSAKQTIHEVTRSTTK